MRRCIPAAFALALACGAPPQKKDEVSVSYRASFTAEAGVNTKVVFPFPVDGTQLTVEQGLTVTDGGTARLEAMEEGLGLTVEGKGRVEASFNGARVKGLAEGSTLPDAQLTRPVPDGGVGDRYLRVNKGGSALVQVQFEYTAARDCGSGCGGTRSWKFDDLVGLGLQPVSMTFSEGKKP